MERQRAEITGAEAAAAGGQAELNLGNRGHAAQRFVARVIRAAVGKIVDLVHLLLGKRLLRRILDDEFVVGVRLQQPLCRKRVGVLVLQIEALSIFFLAFDKLRVGRKCQIRQIFVRRFDLEHRAVNVGNVVDIQPVVECVGNFHNRALAHAVDEKVCLRIQQNRALELVGPVVVVGKPSETCLNATDDNGRFFVALANQVAVDRYGVVRALAHDAAGRVGVRFAVMAGDGVVVDHRVHVAAADQKAETRLPQDRYRIGIFPIRLGDDANLVAVRFQNARDDRVPERRMVDVSVADNIDEVALRPAAAVHIFFADGQKFCHMVLPFAGRTPRGVFCHAASGAAAPERIWWRPPDCPFFDPTLLSCAKKRGVEPPRRSCPKEPLERGSSGRFPKQRDRGPSGTLGLPDTDM